MLEIQPMLQLLETMGYETAHNDMLEPLITIYPDDKKMTFLLNGGAFEQFIVYRFMQTNGTSPKKQMVDMTMTFLEGQAIYESDMAHADIRLMGDLEMIEIDLCDPSYQAVQVTANGFEIVTPENLFFRRHGMHSLPVPFEMTSEDVSEAFDEFYSFLNVDEDQFKLAVGVLLMAFHPTGPYPLVFVQGGEGAGKGSFCEGLKSVTDPNKTPHTTLSKTAADLVIQAASNRILSFDNVSRYTFNEKVSDLLSQMSTGIGLRKRALYTDDGESVMNLSRMVLLNSIDYVIKQQDLLSRAIGFNLNRVSDEDRITKREFKARLEAVRPRVFSAIVNALVHVLRNFDEVDIQSGSRMIDMIQWVTAAEPVLGWEPLTFQRLYEQNQQMMQEIGLSDDPLATAIIRFMSTIPTWEGDASSLLSCLNSTTERPLRNAEGWPRSPISLGQGLLRIEASLRQLGITISREGRTATSRPIQIVNTHLMPQETVV